MQTIVVGVDGSAHGELALEFAAQEAAVREARLLVVGAWESPMTIAAAGVYPVEAFQSLRDNVESIVQTAVARVAELHPRVTCEGKVVEGQPAAVLIREARDAEM